MKESTQLTAQHPDCVQQLRGSMETDELEGSVCTQAVHRPLLQDRWRVSMVVRTPHSPQPPVSLVLLIYTAEPEPELY